MTKEDTFHPVSLPVLNDFNWRIDMISSADNVNRMAVPTCILQFNIEDHGNVDTNVEKKAENVTVELSKQTLDTMLDGLGKIRDQLNSVVKR